MKLELSVCVCVEYSVMYKLHSYERERRVKVSQKEPQIIRICLCEYQLMKTAVRADAMGGVCNCVCVTVEPAYSVCRRVYISQPPLIYKRKYKEDRSCVLLLNSM